MKTAELTGTALDWAVAKCEGAHPQISYPDKRLYGAIGDTFDYSTDWSQGGPIIEQKKIRISWVKPAHRNIKGCWAAERNTHIQYGPTPLVAAMRCYVASKMGDEIDIPKELKNGE